MKNKITPEQWSLEQCITHGLNGLDEATRDHFRKNPEYHDEFGRWLRNNCGLWQHGTAQCVADIVHEYRAGRLASKYLDENTFTHVDLPFDFGNTPRASGADNQLVHPDNCSAVIVEQIFQRLHDGC